MKIKNILNTKRKGFSGITHMLIATILFQLIWILPIFSDRVDQIKEKGLFAIIVYWGIILGASLIPDLDNNMSTAGFSLGALGKIITMNMQMISSVVYNTVKTKKDTTKSQHRMLFHTPFMFLFGILIISFFIPESDYTIFSLVKNMYESKTFSVEGINISSMSFIFLYYILCCASFHLFANSLCYWLGKFFSKKFFRAMRVVMTYSVMFYLGFFTNISNLKFMSYAVAIGSFFHNIGDLFSLGSIPLFFPIPIKNQFWYKPRLPFQIETRSLANQILNFALIITILAMVFVMNGILDVGIIS